MDDVGTAFDRIYSGDRWKQGQSASGPGSDPDATTAYRAALSDFIRRRSIRSVVDIGCGDWCSTRLMDLAGVDYLGLDVVPSVIDANRQAFTRPGVRFELRDASDGGPIPVADLVICKDVLQHLPDEAIRRVLDAISRSARCAILTNDFDAYNRGGWRQLWRPQRIASINSDIAPGRWRILRLRAAPWDLNAETLLTYKTRRGNTVWWKESLVWSPSPR